MTERLEIASRGLFARKVILDRFGVRRGSTVIAWAEVDHYVYDWQDWSRPGDIIVVAQRPTEIRIAPMFDRWHAAADFALSELHAALGSEPAFDPFALVRDSLEHLTEGRLPLSEIREVELAAIGREVIVVVHASDAGEWVQLPACDVANLWRFLECLIERGVTIRSPLPLHLPPMLASVDAAIVRDGQLPTARLLPT